MPIGAILGKIFSSGASKLVDSIGTSLDSLITNKEELALAKIEMEKVINANMEEMERLNNEANGMAQKELTERLRIDMAGDSWLSRNIRPMMLIALFTIITILAITDSIEAINFKVDDGYKEIFKYGFMAALSFYYIGREIIKGMKVKKDK